MDNTIPISVLIIEDNPGDQLLLYENLNSTHLLFADIIMVDTLAEGIVKLGEQNFSLVFLDLFLPDSSGLDSFKELLKVASRVPVIIYSGLSDTQIALNAIALGAQDFLIKGDYSVSLLEKAIRYSIERKNNLDALEESVARYDLVSKATHDMVWDWNLITGDIYRNIEGWRKIFRTVENKSIGSQEDWRARIHPDDREKVKKINDEIFTSEEQEVFEVECRVLRDDGTIGYIQDRGYIIRDDKGKPIRFIGASHDITERKLADQKVVLSEQRFKSLVQNSSDLLAILNAEGNYIYVSPTSKKILGYEPGFFTGKSPFSFIHEDDLEITTQVLATIFNTPHVVAPLFRFKHANGEWRWIESALTNMIDDPSVGGIVVNSRDVTDKKIANDEIEKLSLVAKNTVSGVFILDAERKIQWVNDAFTRITGFTLDDAFGKMPPQLLYGKDPDPSLFTYLRSQMDKGLPYEGERVNYTKSGKPITVWLQLQALYDGKGKLKQYFAVQTDITEKKQAEDELKKLSLVAKETINGVVIRDQNQNIVWVNNAFTKMYGYELNEIIGRDPLDLLQGEDTDMDVVQYVRENLIKKDPFVFEILYYSKHSEKIYARIQVQPIFDENGEVKQSFALHTDITQQKKLEEIVEQEKIIKQKEITEAVFVAQENERSEIGRELHDNVNQLLGATRLYIDMAKNDEVNRQSLLTNASTFTLNAIEEIRKLSKTLITPLIKEIGLADSIKDLIEEIMLVHPIDIISELKFIEEGLSDKFKLNIFRIVQEQINNVLKHAQAKKININIEDNYGKLLLSIIDDGVGFDTNKRKRGVGLTNIKSRSELYNGIAQLTSEPTKGTSLSIIFNKADLLKDNHAVDSQNKNL